MHTPQSVVSIAPLERRAVFRILVEVRGSLSLMVPARPRDTIAQFLREVERLVAGRAALKAPRLFVEDLYEVDPRFSVEECLADLQRVVVLPGVPGLPVPKPPATLVEQVSEKLELSKKQ